MPAEIVPGRFCASWFGTYKVQGSQGDFYYVTLGGEAAHCTCDGFRFRQSCRHIRHVLDYACCWNCQWHEGNPAPHLQPDHSDYPNIIPGDECPNCGGDVVPVRIAV